MSGGDFQHKSTTNFNKKIESLTHTEEGEVFISDKFGDIYSMKTDYNLKYQNSNLGIPTFLQYIKGLNKSYIAVGDEDSRVKLYNQAKMH